MRTILYDLSQLAGISLITAGAWLQWSMPIGLMAAGVLLLALSLVDAAMAAPRAPQD